MAIVQAVRRDLANANAPPELRMALDEILVNEAEMAVRTVADSVR